MNLSRLLNNNYRNIKYRGNFIKYLEIIGIKTDEGKIKFTSMKKWFTIT